MLVYTMVFLFNRFYEVRKFAPTAGVIGEYKLKASAEEFCAGTQFGCLLEEAYSYLFDQEPDYGKLKHMMKMIMIDNNIDPCRNFNWNVPLSEDDH